MTGDLCMKTLHTDKDQTANQSKRPRESPVEYVWKKETRRVDGPDELRKLEEGEWELAETWVRYIKNRSVQTYGVIARVSVHMHCKRMAVLSGARLV